jgi:dTDP-4-dehydrorhamnose reductase
MPEIGGMCVVPRLFVTGASGLLGANFVVAAADSHYVTACHCRNRWQWPGVENISLDLRQEDQAMAALERVRPDVIVHFAAATNVDRCEGDRAEAYEMNVRVTERLARYAKSRGARMLFMSTDSVFDGRLGGYVEADEPRPLNYYARTKLDAEDVVRKLVPQHLIVRANIYGWNAQPKSSLSEWVLQRLETGQAVAGFADVLFAPLLANSLSEIILKLLAAGADGLVHIASRDVISKYHFALAIAEQFGLPARQVKRAALADAAMKAQRPLNTVLRSTRLLPEFGIHTPAVRQDLQRFRELRETGFVLRLKTAS